MTRTRPLPWYNLLLTGAALALGLLIARFPLTTGAGLLLGLGLAAAACLEPALGIGLAVVIGPVKAFLAVARPDLPSDPGQLVFALAVGGWLARGLARREIRLPRMGLLLPLSAWLLVGLLSLLPARSLEEGLPELVKWAEIILALVILSEEFQRGRRAWILAAILLAGLVQALAGLWQYDFQDLARGPEHFRVLGDHLRAYGSFEQPNPYGGFLGLIWPVAAGLALGQAERLWAAWRARGGLGPYPPERLPPRTRPPGLARGRLVPAGLAVLAAGTVGGLALAGLYVSFSRGAWLGAAGAALAMAVFWPRRLEVGLAVLALALAGGLGLMQSGLVPASIVDRLGDLSEFTTVADVRGANINDANFAILERLAHWQAAWDMARDHPWLGVGLGNYAAAYPDYRLLNWPNPLGHAHMIYLNVLAETGALGLVTYVTLWGWVFALTIQAVRRAPPGQRGLALGLLGAWAHLSTHQLVDNLYVNNIHFLLAALLALLADVGARPAGHVRTDA